MDTEMDDDEFDKPASGEPSDNDDAAESGWRAPVFNAAVMHPAQLTDDDMLDITYPLINGYAAGERIATPPAPVQALEEPPIIEEAMKTLQVDGEWHDDDDDDDFGPVNTSLGMNSSFNGERSLGGESSMLLMGGDDSSGNLNASLGGESSFQMMSDEGQPVTVQQSSHGHKEAINHHLAPLASGQNKSKQQPKTTTTTLLSPPVAPSAAQNIKAEDDEFAFDLPASKSTLISPLSNLSSSISAPTPKTLTASQSHPALSSVSTAQRSFHVTPLNAVNTSGFTSHVSTSNHHHSKKRSLSTKGQSSKHQRKTDAEKAAKTRRREEREAKRKLEAFLTKEKTQGNGNSSNLLQIPKKKTTSSSAAVAAASAKSSLNRHQKAQEEAKGGLHGLLRRAKEEEAKETMSNYSSTPLLPTVAKKNDGKENASTRAKARGGGLTKKQQQQSKGWSCGVCSFHNPPDFLQCSMCTSVKPSKVNEITNNGQAVKVASVVQASLSLLGYTDITEEIYRDTWIYHEGKATSSGLPRIFCCGRCAEPLVEYPDLKPLKKHLMQHSRMRKICSNCHKKIPVGDQWRKHVKICT